LAGTSLSILAEQGFFLMTKAYHHSRDRCEFRPQCDYLLINRFQLLTPTERDQCLTHRAVLGGLEAAMRERAARRVASPTVSADPAELEFRRE
jgi:hypothetical protein